MEFQRRDEAMWIQKSEREEDGISDGQFHSSYLRLMLVLLSLSLWLSLLSSSSSDLIVSCSSSLTVDYYFDYDYLKKEVEDAFHFL